MLDPALHSAVVGAYVLLERKPRLLGLQSCFIGDTLKPLIFRANRRSNLPLKLRDCVCKLRGSSFVLLRQSLFFGTAHQPFTPKFRLLNWCRHHRPSSTQTSLMRKATVRADRSHRSSRLFPRSLKTRCMKPQARAPYRARMAGIRTVRTPLCAFSRQRRYERRAVLIRAS